MVNVITNRSCNFNIREDVKSTRQIFLETLDYWVDPKEANKAADLRASLSLSSNIMFDLCELDSDEFSLALASAIEAEEPLAFL